MRDHRVPAGALARMAYCRPHRFIRDHSKIAYPVRPSLHSSLVTPDTGSDTARQPGGAAGDVASDTVTSVPLYGHTPGEPAHPPRRSRRNPEANLFFIATSSPSPKQNVNVTIAYKKPGSKLFRKNGNPRMNLAFDIGNEAGKCGRKTRRALRGAS